MSIHTPWSIGDYSFSFFMLGYKHLAEGIKSQAELFLISIVI